MTVSSNGAGSINADNFRLKYCIEGKGQDAFGDRKPFILSTRILGKKRFTFKLDQLSIPIFLGLGRYDYWNPPFLWEKIRSYFNDLTIRVFGKVAIHLNSKSLNCLIKNYI